MVSYKKVQNSNLREQAAGRILLPCPTLQKGGTIMARLAALERQNQELTAKVKAMEEEDALLEPMDTSEVLPSVSDGTFNSKK